MTCENRMSAMKGLPNADVVRLARWQDRRVADRTGVDPHAFTGVALTVSGFACPTTALLETALTPAFTGGELSRN